MNTAETLYDRREFFAFARKKSAHQRAHNHHRPSLQIEPPRWGGLRVTRGQFIGGLLATTAAAILFKPWELLQQETLESLVAQAKKMEDEYLDNNLSNKPTREKFAGILAGIFTFHYPEYFSKQQLIETISWDDTLDQFVRQRMASAGKTGTPTTIQMENERETTATTDNRKRAITVNAAADPFQQRLIDTLKVAPKNWNPLKMLRVSLLHEFNHLVNESKDETIFSIVDPNNQYKDKRIEGFRFIGIDKTGSYASSFNDLHEAVIELLAKDISLSDFGSHISDMASETPGLNMSVIINNLEQTLRAVGINHQALSKLHKSSNLRELLLILAEKAGADSNTPLKNKVEFGSRIARVIQTNDQRILQEYLNQVHIFNSSKN